MPHDKRFLPEFPLNHWWTVAGGAMANVLGVGIFMVYAFGIIGKGISAEYTWDREIVAYCYSAFLVAAGFGTVALGAFIAKYGVRVPTIIFVSIYSASVACVAYLPPVPPLFYVVFVLIGVAGAAATVLPYAVAISGWFDRNRGLALALTVSGSGVGASLIPYLTHYIETNYGWRAGILVIAALTAVVSLLVLFVLVRDPLSQQVPQEVPSPQKPFKFNSILQEYLSLARFWLIAVPVMGISVATFGVMSTLVPMLSDRQFSDDLIALTLTIAGVTSWIGRLLVGVAMDRIFAPYVVATVFGLAVVGVLLFWAPLQAAAILGTALIGLALGAEGDIVTFLASRYFHLKILSKVLGALWVCWAWGGGIGAYLGGVTFKFIGSYDLSLAIYVAILIVSIYGILRLGPYEFPVMAELRQNG